MTSMRSWSASTSSTFIRSPDPWWQVRYSANQYTTDHKSSRHPRQYLEQVTAIPCLSESTVPSACRELCITSSRRTSSTASGAGVIAAPGAPASTEPQRRSCRDRWRQRRRRVLTRASGRALRPRRVPRESTDGPLELDDATRVGSERFGERPGHRWPRYRATGLDHEDRARSDAGAIRQLPDGEQAFGPHVAHRPLVQLPPPNLTTRQADRVHPA